MINSNKLRKINKKIEKIKGTLQVFLMPNKHE